MSPEVSLSNISPADTEKVAKEMSSPSKKGESRKQSSENVKPAHFPEAEEERCAPRDAGY